jgi:Zn finger protein HypA/HybF involved in hydrogenase expression
MLPNPNLFFKQNREAEPYSKLTNTKENAEYYVPSNFKSIEYHQTTTKCPSKSKFRKNLNLVCPKCPSHSYEQNGHSQIKIPLV